MPIKPAALQLLRMVLVLESKSCRCRRSWKQLATPQMIKKWRRAVEAMQQMLLRSARLPQSHCPSPSPTRWQYVPFFTATGLGLLLYGCRQLKTSKNCRCLCFLDFVGATAFLKHICGYHQQLISADACWFSSTACRGLYRPGKLACACYMHDLTVDGAPMPVLHT